jgi:transcriptional regulator with XRE-family HTH domain
MSELYVQLRSRIPVVAEKTYLGTERLHDAQAATGLSNEAVARRIHISEKTWRRWKKEGTIPTASLPAVAEALKFDVGPDESRSALLEDRLEEVRQGLAEVGELRAAVARIEALLLGREASPRDETGRA